MQKKQNPMKIRFYFEYFKHRWHVSSVLTVMGVLLEATSAARGATKTFIEDISSCSDAWKNYADQNVSTKIQNFIYLYLSNQIK